MDLVPCDETARQSLANSLFEVNEAGMPNLKSTDYVARTFPSILVDIARIVTEQATKVAREHPDKHVVIRHQLKPFFMFSVLLGKCPQISSLMYSYFEKSNFQPLPENSYHFSSEEKKIVYEFQGFTDELVIEILTCYFKYLSFNPKWFSVIWNWSELGRFITTHPNRDIRFIAASCLSTITCPTRAQHNVFVRAVIREDDRRVLIDLQMKHRQLFANTFKPCIESKHQKAVDYVRSIGFSNSGYSYCQESIAKLSNVLLVKRDTSQDKNPLTPQQYEEASLRYMIVPNLVDIVSKLAYAISVNRPCLIRGLSGSGKTAILDYIAAKTDRLHPPDYVKVQIGDQIDSKLLIGTYVCTEMPGQFEWVPGPLTQAMTYGSWIVFEDIDMAPSEMVQVIHSVIENGNLSCVASCPIKLESAHPDFRIFFTQRTRQAGHVELSRLGLGFVDRFCDTIDVPELETNDLINVIEAKYKLGPMAQIAINLYQTARNSLEDSSQNRSRRRLTPRDLFKLCTRLARLKSQPKDGKYSSRDLEIVFLDACNCLLASLSRDDMDTCAKTLGKVVNLPSNEVERILISRKLELRQSGENISIGRIQLSTRGSGTSRLRGPMAYTKQSLKLLEDVACCIKHKEPILFVGETGVGKTSTVQHLAQKMNVDLMVVNLSQQSDSSDLLGGYKPIEMREVIRPINQKFEELYNKTLKHEDNAALFNHALAEFVKAKKNSQWLTYLKLVCKFCEKGLAATSDIQFNAWLSLSKRVSQLSKRIEINEDTNPMALAFTDGSLLKAVKEGKWILLDEINLAEPDVLQCLILILDSINQSHIYMQSCGDENGKIEFHPQFRLFACMNPSTDVGKRDLDSGTRGRFTEMFVDEIEDKNDLRLVVESYAKCFLPSTTIEQIVNFYMKIRSISGSLSDISGNPPVYSLRSLCRALTICSNNVCQNMEKSVFESLKIAFFQQLNDSSVETVTSLIEEIFHNGKIPKSLQQPVASAPKDGHQYIDVEGFWIQKSNEEPVIDKKYITTDSIRKNLQNLARIISLSQRKLPILIQGKTSVGKTSMITYLAKITGNRCYRLNNHEHTDLQDYVGRYVLKENGDLVFQEGLLVKAMKKGYWIILDELNLAPSELLEALNRVLDDNRELYIPETRETVRAHSKFVLFATQNPPEEYAGRKFLSRAFRNRFIELHFDDIPTSELEIILQKRCEMAPKHAKKVVDVMKELQILRRESGCFNGKSGFMTLRDLFRWGERYKGFKNDFPDNQMYDWDEHIAREGLVLLEGRVRTKVEAETVKATIEKVFKVGLDRNKVYSRPTYDPSTIPSQFKHVHFTEEFQILFTQLSAALKYREPVLLCGQTGCGKTTACQFYATSRQQKLITYNCHLNTESSDFVGAVRPSREQGQTETSVKQTFPWVNGPLVEAMSNGHVFLVDEISLADDAVLERMNSVLEPGRSITLTEKDGEEISANESFRLVATMNPGGDYGKKELSPALRNRFTEIYCHNTTDMAQIKKIIQGYLPNSLLELKIFGKVSSVMSQFLQEYYDGHNTVSMRDVLSWCNFIAKVTDVNQQRPFSIQEALINGASLVYLDQFGTCGHVTNSLFNSTQLKNKLRSTLRRLIDSKFNADPQYVGDITKTPTLTEDLVQFKKFCLKKGPLPILDITRQFVHNTPIVERNLMKLVRAMQLDRPILLEGDPGAGKTSIVSALAKLTGNSLVRINLSEQTDISDLFGSDLPDAENSDSDAPTFCWHDGPMLRAIRDSSWILLDEMNLASQSVLEGLNACFDHRGEIYIPELNKKIKVDRSASRVFACQNPYNQGAARKGLPQSFINRFTSIYVEAHSPEDLTAIVSNLYPSLPEKCVHNMVDFNNHVNYEFKDFGYEFNLRDILYWCDLTTRYIVNGDNVDISVFQPERFAQFVYLDRIRSETHRSSITETFEKIFGRPIYEPPYRDVRLGEYSFIMARSILPRNLKLSPQLADLCILKCQMPYIESLAKAIEFNKMPILVGEVGVGKRSIVRILAGLTGNVLNVMGANQEMDTIELLGSFEQRSLQREVLDLIDEAKRCVFFMINSISHKEHASTWTNIFKNIWLTLYDTSKTDSGLARDEMIVAYRVQLQQMRDLISKIQPLCPYEVEKVCTKLADKIDKLVQRPYLNEPMHSSGNFAWIDSILIKSIREGNWLIIENANLMNPATLDRLNSLVEPNGSISLSEKGTTSKGIEEIKPHPNFRIILTMDPQNGELSRAMRNRGIEIFMEPRFFFEDFLMLLNQNGFEPEEGKACMAYCVMQTSYDTFQTITGEDPMDEGSLLAFFGLNYLSTLTNQVRRGADIDESLASLLIAHFTQTGYGQICKEKNINEFVIQKMDEYRKKYEVNLVDERYKWRHFRHDLVSLASGDSVVAMVERDNRIFYEDIAIDLILKQDEIVDELDIVNTCINVKIFLEFSSHGDFEHREGFLREIFQRYPSMMCILNGLIEELDQEHLPLINSLMTRFNSIPASEMHVDTRTAPDTHHSVQCMDYEGSTTRIGLQNRWLLALHKIMLSTIVDLVEERTMSIKGNTSLWTLSERVRSREMLKENLVRPVVEIASDLYDLLMGIMRNVINRCCDNEKLAKILPRLFWITYVICKLRRGYNRHELIATCNQITMLWTLTYQKVILPVMEDCKLKDLSYKNKKFSYRIQHICDFLDVNVAVIKLNPDEKKNYHKVVNKFATTTKQCDIIGHEADTFFALLMGRYVGRKHANDNTGSVDPTLLAAGLIWSNSTYLSALYEIQRYVMQIGNNSEESQALFERSLGILRQKSEEYKIHIDWSTGSLQKEHLRQQYKQRCLDLNRHNNSLDQFAPIWQIALIQNRLAKMDPLYLSFLDKVLKHINGIIMSPRYYLTLCKYLQYIQTKSASNELITDRENADMYVAYLQDHMLENSILDCQVVGWTRLRVTTSDLPALAPLLPEYSPIVSLVASYCLDIAHLKLNSLTKSTQAQLDGILVYFWNYYTAIKSNSEKDTQDLSLARNLVSLRSKLAEDGPQSVEDYIRRQIPNYDQLMDLMATKLHADDVETAQKSIKLIYFGYLNFLDYAPIFTLDPSLRAREKMEVYKSELAHIKMDLHFRNTLYYWKTGDNLQLLEIEPEFTSSYPFATRLLVARRCKLEKSISKLRNEQINRPKTDDGSMYHDLRKEVEVNMNSCTNNIHLLMDDLATYAHCEDKARSRKFTNLLARCSMLIKILEKTVSRFRSNYAIYTDLLSNFVVGLCFVLQGLRCLYSRLEQKLQIYNLGFNQTISQHANNIKRAFSFNDFSLRNLDSVRVKLEFLPHLDMICPAGQTANHIQSLMLKTVLIQMNHHITISPSDIKLCIPIVKQIADLFHRAWLKRKQYLEEQRKQKEELYQYKSSRILLDNDVTYEQREFLDICARFPTYDYIYQNTENIKSNDIENLTTEAKMTILNRNVDLSACIDICKAHYKFTKQAGNNLLGQVDSSKPRALPTIDIEKWTQLEAETLYAVIRHCIPTLDRDFDSMSIECHLLQAEKLRGLLQKSDWTVDEDNSIKDSIGILDLQIVDIYHGSNSYEVSRFKNFVDKIDTRIRDLQSNIVKNLESHPILNSIVKLITIINSFLITDPLMKFVTGSHALLEKLEEWNRAVPKEDKMFDETEALIELIKSWRQIEVKSWEKSLVQVKRKYIDSTLCDLWFHLYAAFNDPMSWGLKVIKEEVDDQFELKPEHEQLIYKAFTFFVRDFFDQATFGDYQMRLDLVFSFTIQTRFAGLYEQSKKMTKESSDGRQYPFKIDYEKLTTYVYNIYITYKGLFGTLDEMLAQQEREFQTQLKQEIRIVSWQNRNLLEIKENFRRSHKKLNKVMNEYLKMLQAPFPAFKPPVKIDDVETEELNSDRISATLSATQLVVSSIEVPVTNQVANLKSLAKTPTYVTKMKHLHNSLHDQMSTKYIESLMSLEQFKRDAADLIANFKSHTPSEVIIDNRKDSKEVQREKIKLFHQMHQSKKFALQSIFKNLAELGVSYRRGILRGQQTLEEEISSSEPIRGMIQDQCRLVLKAADKLVDQQVIQSCKDGYECLISNQTFLQSQHGQEDLNRGHIERIKGGVFDMTLDAVKHNRSAAFIYKHMMDVQAIASRLIALDDLYKVEEVTIYNFSKVQMVVRQFDELVGRSYLAVGKLEQLAKCCKVALDIACKDPVSEPDAELRTLLEIINKDDEHDCKLISHTQMKRFEETILETRQTIATVSENLRDMLKHTSRNYLYSNDDVSQLEQLYDEFINSFRRLVPDLYSGSANTASNTILGSLKLLEDEAVEKLKPQMDRNQLKGSEEPDLNKLDLRMRRMIRQIKLAAQKVYEREMSLCQPKRMTETEKRNSKPFNQLDSTLIKNLLRLDKVAKHAGDCLATMNKFDCSTNLGPIIASIRPILSIYSQDVSRYLNIILASLNLRLSSANQLIYFFTEVLLDGYGLPYKVNDTDETDQKAGKPSEDNAGFGEGQGETDVSKKLEFESQLDELKKDEQQADKEKDEEMEVEAHDDGIEMSDDIDAKAQGPDENGDQGKDQEEGDEDDQQDLNDLDKELDRVDQDEDKLDKNLWGDEDDSAGEEDDEQDLRETDVDQGMQPDSEGIDLLAKDDEISDAKPKTDKQNETSKEASEAPATDVPMEQAEDSEGKPDENDNKIPEEPTSDIEKPDTKTDEAGEPREDIDDNEELDLTKEAEEALQGPEETDEAAEGPTEESKVMDMSLSDDGKSEGDISGEDTELNSQDVLDDESIDKQLEVAMDPNEDDLASSNPLEDIIHNLPQAGRGLGKDKDGPQDIKGTQIGNHTLYNIFPEHENDPIDFDESKEMTTDEAEQETRMTVDEPAAASGNGPSAGDKASMETDDDQDRSEKRTLADRSDEAEDQGSEVKRQRIQEASKEPDHKEDKSQKKDADTVRHIEKDTSTAIEVIDIADSTDDECIIEDEPGQGGETKLTEKPAATSSSHKDAPEKDVSSKETAQDVISEEIKKEELPIETSSISSITSELLEAESDYEDCVEEGGNSAENSDRLLNTSYNTNIGLLKYISLKRMEGSGDNAGNLMELIDKEISKKVSNEYDSVDTDRLTTLWLDCTRSTSHLMNELCQQLQIVLQPTKMSKYKGDYKSGKRLNMRKIISYIASHYRKDKIWLRRTKPNKRTYNITLAVDNSSSMSENNCRQMTYQSLALLAGALSRIEAGSLSVMSFGEKVKCIHEFGTPYMDAIGAQWLRELRFNESMTSYQKLLEHACRSFERQAQFNHSQQSPYQRSTVSQLLIVISDGRNISSEEDAVKDHLSQLKSMGVLTLFVIIDDLKRNSGKSIIDVKRCLGSPSSGNFKLVKYMELFPFPFYVLLRQLETMPSVLGDALRQWFELVSSV